MICTQSERDMDDYRWELMDRKGMISFLIEADIDTLGVLDALILKQMEPYGTGSHMLNVKYQIVKEWFSERLNQTFVRILVTGDLYVEKE